MTAPRHPLDGRAIALLVVCCAIWGLAQVAAKTGLADWPPLLQAALRSAGAALMVAAWTAAHGRDTWRALWARDGTWRGGLLAGLLFAAEFACIFAGLQFTSASRMSVFIYLAPFVVALGMPFIDRRETLAPAQLAGLVLAFGGVVLAFGEGFTAPAGGPRLWWGDALGVAAALGWALTTLSLRATRLGSAPAEKALLWQLAVSAPALGLASLLAGERWPAVVSAPSLGALAFQTVVVSFASYLVWFWLVRRHAATQLSAFTLLTPVFGLLAGVLLLGEAVTPRLLGALAAVCAGLLLVQRARRQAAG
jgi:drug/metabolite transporter (DMT)-like permease